MKWLVALSSKRLPQPNAEVSERGEMDERCPCFESGKDDEDRVHVVKTNVLISFAGPEIIYQALG